MKQGKARILTALFLIFFMQLYCLFIVFKGPIIGITLIQSQDQSWYIQQIQEASWGEYNKLKPYTKVLEIDGMRLSTNASSPFSITNAESLTILHEGEAKILTVSYEGLNAQIIKQLIIPVIYASLTSALCIFLLKRLLTKNKQHLIFHLQFTALAYISASAAGRGDFISNIVNSLAIFLSLVNCIYYCNHFLRTISDSVQKKLRIIFVFIGISLVAIYVVRIFIRDFLAVQIIFELSIYLILSCLLVINIVRAGRGSTKYYAKLLFSIFFLGIGPFALCYVIPTILNEPPILPADVTALFLLIVPVCLIYLELAESFFNLQYALDRMFSHLQLVIPFSLVLSFALLLLGEVRSFHMYSLYFLIIFISSILLLLYKEGIEVRNARYLSTLKDYSFADFYRFIKSSTQYATNFDNLIDYIKKELSLMLMLNSIEIIEDDLTQHLHNIDVKNYRVVCPNLIYKNQGNYILVLHEALDSKLIAIVNTRFRIIPSGSLKMLELFLYYVHSIIDNSLKMDDLMAQLTKLDNLNSPRWYSRLWVSSSERERIRLSTEIHDTILQDLIRISRNMEEAMVTTKDRYGKEAFSHLREEMLDIMDITREICEDLYPPLINRLGLNRSLEELFEKCKIRFNFLIRDDIEVIEGLSLQQATTIYRIIQELLSNANKHSQAHAVHITLTTQVQQIFIEYTDDGMGMDADFQLDDIKSMGLIGIQERIKTYHGAFEITSNRPRGTVIKLSMKIGEDFENYGVR